MAAFRYRIFDATGLIAGFRDLETAEYFSREISLKIGKFVSIQKTTHGKGLDGLELAGSWLHGERVE